MFLKEEHGISENNAGDIFLYKWGNEQNKTTTTKTNKQTNKQKNSPVEYPVMEQDSTTQPQMAESPGNKHQLLPLTYQKKTDYI